jgi:hypothetical protein
MRIKFPVLAIFLTGFVATSLGACGSDSSGAPSCNNNGMWDEGEQCDGNDLHGASCMMVLMMANVGGSLSCNNCQFVTTMCTMGAGGANGTGGSNSGTGGGP